MTLDLQGLSLGACFGFDLDIATPLMCALMNFAAKESYKNVKHWSLAVGIYQLKGKRTIHFKLFNQHSLKAVEKNAIPKGRIVLHLSRLSLSSGRIGAVSCWHTIWHFRRSKSLQCKNPPDFHCFTGHPVNAGTSIKISNLCKNGILNTSQPGTQRKKHGFKNRIKEKMLWIF